VSASWVKNVWSCIPILRYKLFVTECTIQGLQATRVLVGPERVLRSCSAGQKVHAFVWNPKMRCCVHWTCHEPDEFSLATRLRAGRSGFDSRQVLGIFPFATASRPALEPTQHPIQWVPGVLSPVREAVHSPPSLAEVKSAWSYASNPPLRLNGVVLG
jgi:hypothetical protein